MIMNKKESLLELFNNLSSSSPTATNNVNIRKPQATTYIRKTIYGMNAFESNTTYLKQGDDSITRFSSSSKKQQRYSGKIIVKSFIITQ